MNLRGTGCEGARWVELVQDRVKFQWLALSLRNLRLEIWLASYDMSFVVQRGKHRMRIFTDK